jgi:D-alanine-D-alanine ligase
MARGMVRAARGQAAGPEEDALHRSGTEGSADTTQQQQQGSRGTAVIWFNQPAPDAPPDSLDLLEQVRTVGEALRKLGFTAQELPFTLDFEALRRSLRALDPAVVVNLVESVEEDGRLCHLAPAMLEFLGVKFTGCPSYAMYTTTNKLLAKRLFLSYGVDTAPWLSLHDSHGFEDGAAYVIKAVGEDASIGMGEDAVVSGLTRAQLLAELARRSEKLGREQFAERYIDGREFNIAVVGTNEEPALMPVAELLFPEVWKDKAYKVFGYGSKWDETHEAYISERRYDFDEKDAQTLSEIRRITELCWRQLRFKGYARADYRVDSTGRPWLLEFNANPGIAPDSGFVAAVQRSGQRFEDVIGRIVELA